MRKLLALAAVSVLAGCSTVGIPNVRTIKKDPQRGEYVIGTPMYQWADEPRVVDVNEAKRKMRRMCGARSPRIVEEGEQLGAVVGAVGAWGGTVAQERVYYWAFECVDDEE